MKEKHFERKSVVKKEPFEFKLTINDNIICQRYFPIDNFDAKCKGSQELINSINYCVDLIKYDLSSKTRTYLWYMTPLVFRNEESLTKWLTNSNNTSKLEIGALIVVEDNKVCDFYWDGEKVMPHKSKKEDLDINKPTDEIVFKLTFSENKRDIISKVWDGSVYPKFIRNGVDISNWRGKFTDSDPNKMSFEAGLLHRMYVGKEDLIAPIIREFQRTCSTYKTYTSLKDYPSIDILYSQDKLILDARESMTMASE